MNRAVPRIRPGVSPQSSANGSGYSHTSGFESIEVVNEVRQFEGALSLRFRAHHAVLIARAVS